MKVSHVILLILLNKQVEIRNYRCHPTRKSLLHNEAYIHTYLSTE